MSKSIKRMEKMRNCLNCRNAEIGSDFVNCDEISEIIDSLEMMIEPCSYWQIRQEQEAKNET